jgi:pSer/pThr/pTyr-binding forkhead associated (FHA) protein
MHEVTLTIYDVETGDEERVHIDSRRFTIGRLPENDLMIDDTNFSRRHAIIETVDESITISDCGSQNGTFVNDRPVIGTVQLHDGDVLTFGGSKEITVEIGRESTPVTSYSNGVSVTQTRAKNPVQGAGKSTSVFGAAPPWLNAPVVAAAAAVLILLGAGLLLALNRAGISAPPKKASQSTSSEGSPAAATPDDVVKPDDAADSTVKPKDDVANDVTKPSNDSDELRIIDKHARAVMSSISDDSRPVLPSEVVSQINARVKKYSESSFLREELRTIRQRGLGQLTSAAKDNDIKPPLAVFAALAKMDRDGQRNDPLALAQALLPALRSLQRIFGTELANDSLLIVATLDQPPKGNFHPLQLAINKLANDTRESPAKIRTVWYLHDHQKLSSEAYELVLRFLAIGVIAQDPRHFKVDAEPLVF